MERRQLGRREQDDVLKLLAPHIHNDETVQSRILEKLEKIEATQEDIKQILVIYRNTKSFFLVSKVLGLVAIFFAAVYGALEAISYGIRLWLKS